MRNEARRRKLAGITAALRLGKTRLNDEEDPSDVDTAEVVREIYASENKSPAGRMDTSLAAGDERLNGSFVRIAKRRSRARNASSISIC